jgi:integrase
LLLSNPVDRVTPPKVAQGPLKVIDIGEVQALLEAAKRSWAYPAIALAAFTGMRRSEVIALQWSDLDLEAGTLTVSHSIDDLHGVVKISKPKTARSARLIELPAPLVDILKVMQPTRSPFLFPAPDGGLRHPDSLTNAFRNTVTRAGLKKVRLHDLRHAHASILLSLGYELPVVSARLGHASTAVTSTIYAHAIRGRQRQAADAFGEAVSKPLAKLEKT